MLVLSRRKGEQIYCYDNNGTFIKFIILPDVDNKYPSQVRVGIEAPKHITVDRAEIYEEKLREMEERYEGN